MKLTLHKFKCWQNLTLEIPIGAMVLLKGRSGQGKSTILKAIAWALYGQVKKITPHHMGNAKTTVTYEYNNVTITRSKNPNKLIYDDGVMYEDAEAQTKINFIYGEYDVWLSTSYVGQRLQNYFLIASNLGKMELLNKIAFHEEDPNEYLEKIEKHYNEARTQHQCQLDLYQKKLEQINDYDCEISKYYKSSKDVDFLHDQLLKLKEQHCYLIEKKNKKNIELAIKHNKEEELKNIVIEDVEIPLKLSFDLINGRYKVENELEKFEKHYKEFKSLMEIREKKIFYEKQLKNIDKITESFTIVDLQQSIYQETTYAENDILFKQLDLTHDIEEVNDYIDYLNTILEAQERLSKQQQLDELTINLNNLPNIISDYTKYDFSELQNQIDNLVLEQGSLQHQLQHLIESQNSISCPYCEEEVLYKNGQLVKVTVTDNTDVDSVNKKLSIVKDNINKLKKEISDLKLEESKIRKENEQYSNTKQHLLSEIEKLTLNIKTLPINDCDKLLSVKEKEQVYKTLLKLKNIKIVTLPTHKSDDIKMFFKNKEEYDKQQQLLEQYNTLPDSPYIVTDDDLVIMNDFIKNYKIKLNYLMAQQQRKKLLKEQIDQMIIEEVEDVDIENKILTIEEQIEKSKKAYEMINQHDILSQERDMLLDLTTKANYLGELKQIASNIECKVLEGLVGTISSHVYDVCQNMFDQEIKMDIHLYKLLKSARVKPSVNFTVIYQGGVYDSVHDLSFGELDRTSLAMTLALNRISTGHIMIFDETLKGLDTELQMDVVKNIRENCNSTVFIVDHDGLEGMFDHVIDVTEYQQFRIMAS